MMMEGVKKIERRPFTRYQAKARALSLAPESVRIDSPSVNSSMLSLSNVYFRSRKCAKRSVPNTNISVKKQGNLMNESMPTAEDDYIPPGPENVPAAIDTIFASVPIQEDNVAAEDTLDPNNEPSSELCVKKVKLEMDETMSQTCNNHGLTEVVDILDSGEEAVSSAFVSVGCYRVKKVAAPMLKRIVEKHGDIASDCSVTNVATRSMFLQMVCDIMQTLQVSRFVDITESEIRDMVEVVDELGKFDMRIGWLRVRLEEILEAMKLIKDYPSLKETKAANKKAKKESRKVLRSYKDEVMDHKAKILEYTCKISESESAIEALQGKALIEYEKLRSTRAESKGIKARVSRLGARVRMFISDSLIQDLH